MPPHRDIVDELKGLLTAHPGWDEKLENSVSEAKHIAMREKVYGCDWMPGDLPGYYKYLEKAVHWIPCEKDRREVYYHLCIFYFLLDQPDGKDLQKHDEFTGWMRDFANQWGSYLDNTDSAAHLDTFLNDPDYGMWQYQIPPGGYLTFNEFFRRLTKPGLRPVIGMGDKIITSPADSTFQQQFRISRDSEVVVKFTHKYKITDLLEGSPYRDAFGGGIFAHAFLGPNDYHRFRAPVSGVVLESRAIQQEVYLGVEIRDGEWFATDETDYQFKQTRGLIIIDNPVVGLVAILPIGMAQVSSVNMTAVEGSTLAKGDEFGFFQFGGSDIIMLFQKGKGIRYKAAPGIHYNCNTPVAEVVRR